MKFLISLTLLVSVLSVANAQESSTPSGASHCSNARFEQNTPSSSTQDSGEEVKSSNSIDG